MRFYRYLGFCRGAGATGAALLALLSVGAASAAVVTNINIVDFAFQPSGVTVQPGDSVTWTWVGSDHSSTSDTGDATVWDSQVQNAGFVFTNMFPNAGSFPFHCKIHASMTGAITVQSAVATNQPPSITTQPQNLTVLLGSNATFTVVATGTAPLSYQWQFSGTNISGATSANFTLMDAQFTNQGSYSVVVSNAFGVTNSSAATLTVTTNLPANFALTKAAYYGLFYDESGGVALGSSGSFKMVTTSKGNFNGMLQTATGHFPFHGVLGTNGAAQGVVAGHGTTTLTLNFQINGDEINGSVTGGGFNSDLEGFQAVFDARTNTCPEAGKYTMALPGDGVGTSQPGGDSVFTVSIDPSGKVKISGWMGEGTHVAANSVLSGDGACPLFVALPASGGSLLAWVNFSGSSSNVPSGLLSWIKAAKATSRFYPGGFTVETNLIGSPFQAPAKGSPVLNLASPIVILMGSDLGQSVTNPVTLHLGKASYGMGGGQASQPSVKFNSSLGTFIGSVPNQSGGKPIKVIGVALQNANVGRGYFLGTAESGQALLQSQ